MGVIHSTNITPDAATGIGKWSVQDFRRAMHEGVAPDGRHLFPAFPYTSFTKVSDDDVKAIYAYLKRVFGNPKIRVVPRPKKDDSAEVYIGEEFIGVLFVDDEDDDRSFQFQMAILEEDLVE